MDLNQALYQYLVQIGFTDEDIDLLETGYPELKTLSAKQALINVAILVQSGYPEDDIQSLIAMNPGFLLNEPSELARKVLTLGVDIEAVLKDDPSLV